MIERIKERWKQIQIFIKRTPWLRNFAERVYFFWKGLLIHPIFFQRQAWIRQHYFTSSFRVPSFQVRNSVKLSKQNERSFDFEHGVTLARYNGRSYFFQVDPGNTIESYIAVEGAWEPYLLRVLELALVAREGIFVDVGANIGATTIPLAVCNRKQHVVCFEPHPMNCKRLRENKNMNKLEAVRVEEKAVSDVSGKLVFYAQRGSKNMGLSSLQLNHDIENHEMIDVAAVTLDEYFRGRKIPCTAIKIDVQGFEWQVLQGAKEIIEQDRPYIFFEHEDEYFSSSEAQEMMKKNLSQFFEEYKYVMCALPHPENGFMPRIVFDGYFHGDIIAIPLEDKSLSLPWDNMY